MVRLRWRPPSFNFGPALRTNVGQTWNVSPQILLLRTVEERNERVEIDAFLVAACYYQPSPPRLSSRQLRVSGFTRSAETIECGTKRETATHFALLVASRCNTTTLTPGSRPTTSKTETMFPRGGGKLPKEIPWHPHPPQGGGIHTDQIDYRLISERRKKQKEMTRD